MPSPAPSSRSRSVRHAIDEGSFDPVYYFHGDDDFLKEDAVRRLIARAVDPATKDFNLEQRRGGDLDAETLGTLLDTLPMMAERRVVVVRDAAALRKDARATLAEYLKKPAPQTVLVLVAAAGTKLDKSLVDRTTAVELDTLAEPQLVKWIERHAKEVLRVPITPEAVTLLRTTVGADLPQIVAELEKLASYVQGSGVADAVIDADAVAAVVGVRHGETIADLLDRILARDARGALEVLPHVLLQPKMTAVYIVMVLAPHLLALAWARAALDEGLARSRLTGALFDLLKSAGSTLTARPWGEAVDSWVRNVDRWSAADLDRALDHLLDADIALKESRVSSDEQLLATLVLALCASDVQGRAA